MPLIVDMELLTFLLLAIAVLMLWSSRRLFGGCLPLWSLPFTLALVGGLGLQQLDLLGLIAIALLFLSAYLARTTQGVWPRALAVGMLILLALLLMGHLLPGFEPLSLIEANVLKPGSTPYTKWLGFDKVAAVFALLGIYRPRDGAAGWRAAGGLTSVVAIVVTITVVMLLGVALGRIALSVEPLPVALVLTWGATNLLFTCAAEEGLFRGVVQRGLLEGLEGLPYHRTVAVIAAAMLFGLAHLGGGGGYVLLASVAGLGYGAVYLWSGRLEAAIVGHFLLNSVHLLLFSYPALA